jgi:regulator of sigma D
MSDKLEENVTLEQIEEEYKEVVSIFPALHKYKAEHNTANLQKLCVEVVDFVRAIYSSTQNEQEREILRKYLDKLHNI